MFTITLDPIIAHIGPLVLRWYSLILITAIGIGIWLTSIAEYWRQPSDFLQLSGNRKYEQDIDKRFSRVDDQGVELTRVEIDARRKVPDPEKQKYPWDQKC